MDDINKNRFANHASNYRYDDAWVDPLVVRARRVIRLLIRNSGMQLELTLHRLQQWTR